MIAKSVPIKGAGGESGGRISKAVTNITEHISVQLRIEFYNLFNHTQFTSANGGIDNGCGDGATFGEVFAAALPRLIQLAAKFYF